MFNYEQYEYFSELMILSVSEMQINTLPYFQYGETDASKPSDWPLRYRRGLDH
ncbi:MAG: hypothetical protein LBG28_15640 [Tannerella sp.]|jgi:hypothetical protein|nr:hypothetical protein [Tannerella sp.]